MNISHPVSRPPLLRSALPIAAALVFLALPWVASAQAIDPYPVDNLLARFQGVLGNWSVAVYDVATRLFWALATISLTWTFGMMIFRRADFGELFAELVRFIILTGIFWWLLSSGGGADGHIYSILESMRILGERASGEGQLGPAALLRSAYDVFFEVARQSADDSWKDADKIVGLGLATAVVSLVALAAVSMMIIKMMVWILAFGGLFLLGFGGARWTSGVAINYYKHVLAVGISYFVMLLMAGTGQAFLSDYSAEVVQQVTLPSLAIMLVACIILVALLVRIPNLVASVVLGSRFGGAGGTSFSGYVMSLGGSAVAAGMGVAGQGAQSIYAAYRGQPQPQAGTPPADMGHMTAYINDRVGHGMPVMPGTTVYAQDAASAPSGSAFAATASAVDVARAQAASNAGPASAADGASPGAASRGGASNGDGSPASQGQSGAAASSASGSATQAAGSAGSGANPAAAGAATTAATLPAMAATAGSSAGGHAVLPSASSAAAMSHAAHAPVAQTSALPPATVAAVSPGSTSTPATSALGQVRAGNTATLASGAALGATMASPGSLKASASAPLHASPAAAASLAPASIAPAPSPAPAPPPAPAPAATAPVAGVPAASAPARNVPDVQAPLSSASTRTPGGPDDR